MNKNKHTIEYIVATVMLLYFIFLIILSTSYQVTARYVKADHFKSWLQKHSPVVVDLRETQEKRKKPLKYERVIHIPFLSIEQNPLKIDIPSNEKIVFVCSDGNRARLVSTLLQKRRISTHYLKSGLNSISFNQVSPDHQ